MWIVGLLLVSAPIAAAAQPQPAEDDPVLAAAKQAVKTLDLQVTLPHEVSAVDPGPSWNLHLPPELLYSLAAVALGILVYLIFRMLPAWRSADDDDWTAAGDSFAAGAATADIGLSQADELAARGFFVEAMHLLLLHSLAEIRRRLKLEFADSLTSREILRRARLPEDVTATLRSIVTRVELSYFGGYPAGQPDYDSCRTGFEALSALLAGTRAAAAPRTAG